MKKRRIKKSAIIKLVSVIIIIFALSTYIKIQKYHKTNEYKLKKIGYNKEEISIILNETKENIDYIIENEYDEQIDDIINEKYYLNKNLEKYIEYKKKNENKNLSDVIAIINTNADKEEYNEPRKADIEKKELMLVNKYNYLEENYTPENVKPISPMYAYDENNAPEEVMKHYKEMFYAAKNDGMDLIISSSYRSYKEQKETYEFYEQIKGDDVKNYASLPGFSEHQTGLAFDILTTGVMTDDFDKTNEFKWLMDNSYKYGFILRYPKNKELITKFDYESWHFRYVGIDAAKVIHDENITFEEYYAYYIEK
ncbi:MAG: M15 family metallopeptidase [Bacilli bacterium]